MSDLDDIFNPPEQATEQPIEETKVDDAEVEKVKTDDEVSADSETTAQTEPGKTDAKAEDKAESEDIDKQAWTLAAVKDERRKRQELERKLEELQSQNSKKERPSVFDDENAFAESLREETRQELARAKLDLARDMMMDVHDDYEEMEALFIEKVAVENPVLAEQARKSTNPAKFIYQNSKKYLEYKDMQDVDAYKAKLEAKIRAELEAENKTAQEQKAAKTSDIKPSLAKARASDKQDVVEEVTLESLFAS